VGDITHLTGTLGLNETNWKHMTYAIALSGGRPQGGFLQSGNPEWFKAAFAAQNSKHLFKMFQGEEFGMIDEDWLPKSWIVEKARPVMPDMFWGSCGMMIVSGPYHDIVEDLDPGLHQMWPIDLRRKRKGSFPGRWYGLNIRGRAEAIQIEGSDLRFNPGSEQLGLPDRYILRDSFKVTVAKSALPDAHLWWDHALHTSSPTILCSDNLRDAVVAAGLKPIPFVKSKEV